MTMSVHPGLGKMPALANAKLLDEAEAALRRCWPGEDTTALRAELLSRSRELKDYSREEAQHDT